MKVSFVRFLNSIKQIALTRCLPVTHKPPSYHYSLTIFLYTMSTMASPSTSHLLPHTCSLTLVYILFLVLFYSKSDMFSLFFVHSHLYIWLCITITFRFVGLLHHLVRYQNHSPKKLPLSHTHCTARFSLIHTLTMLMMAHVFPMILWFVSHCVCSWNYRQIIREILGLVIPFHHWLFSCLSPKPHGKCSVLCFVAWLHCYTRRTISHKIAKRSH